jgi:hypothetical protein
VIGDGVADDCEACQWPDEGTREPDWGCHIERWRFPCFFSESKAATTAARFALLRCFCFERPARLAIDGERDGPAFIQSRSSDNCGTIRTGNGAEVGAMKGEREASEPEGEQGAPANADGGECSMSQRGEGVRSPGIALVAL